MAASAIGGEGRVWRWKLWRLRRDGRNLVERLEAAATLLERTLGWLEERQRVLSGEVEKISATVETTRREEELASKLETMERELAELRAAAAGERGSFQGAAAVAQDVPTATAEMLAKHGLAKGNLAPGNGQKEIMNVRFADIHAAADYIGPGAIEVPLYQTEIFDICRRSSPFGQRIKQVPATGHPSRFFEETAIPNPGTAGL
jgi:hypothetical protein